MSTERRDGFLSIWQQCLAASSRSLSTVPGSSAIPHGEYKSRREFSTPKTWDIKRRGDDKMDTQAEKQHRKDPFFLPYTFWRDRHDIRPFYGSISSHAPNEL